MGASISEAGNQRRTETAIQARRTTLKNIEGTSSATCLLSGDDEEDLYSRHGVGDLTAEEFPRLDREEETKGHQLSPQRKLSCSSSLPGSSR